MDASTKRKRNVAPVIFAIGLVSSAFGPAIASAQDAAPGGFSLPAGAPPPQQQPSDVQGPVDSESSPPRRTDEPAESAPAASLPTIAPVPVPTPQQRQTGPARERAAGPRARPDQRLPAQPQTQPQNQSANTDPVATQQEQATEVAPTGQPPATLPLPVPDLPGLPPETSAPEAAPVAETSDGSIWWWLAAGLVALISLIVMGLRQRSSARSAQAAAPAPEMPTDTVPTPPLRSPPQVSQPPAPQPAPPARAPAASVPFGMLQGDGLSFGTTPAPAPAPAPEPSPAPTQAPAPEPQPAAGPTPQPPRLLLDFTTLGVDVTLVNAVARYHLGITNMSDIPISDIALHGTVVQARRGMPPTIDPLRGDSLLPLLQKVADIAPEGTQRCEGQIRLPLEQIEPIEMQGRLLFVPVVHIWIGYTGPDGTRYAVTQSFVLGEESSPPGARVGPLRLDLGPRRFTEVGQRPLEPA